MKQFLVVLLSVLFLVVPANAQTFRGAINGTVTDPSGAVVPGATVKAIDAATNIGHTTVTTGDGQYSFQDLPVGTYKILVKATGFPDSSIDNVRVVAGAIYTLEIKLKLEQSQTTVEVSAAALTLDTTTEAQTTVIPGSDLQAVPLNGRDFTQLIGVTPGFSGYSAGGYGSLNGTRANQMNWQIDGVDNNDLWHNIPAVNQGGVSGIAGIVLPIDSIEEFSAQTQSSPETGRNPGGTVNLVLKSGGNSLHGTLYYFNRNEAYAASPAFTDKIKMRNYQFGGSAGGPIWKDHTFFFATFEKQRFIIGIQGLATEPSTAYQSAALQELSDFGVSPNPVSQSLLANLWPTSILPAPATANNYASSDPEFGYSYNGLVRVDHKINANNTISAHWFAGQGNQVAPVGSNLLWYYEGAPIHVQNYSITWNSTLSTRLTNQLLAGVNYFNQVFYDFANGFNANDYGLFVSPSITVLGAPRINISGFDSIGLTPPSGRNDITGHLTDTASYVTGKHQFRFGGEYRQAQLQEFYHRRALGVFSFDGSRGPNGDGTVPWTNPDPNVNSLADFLAGNVRTSNVAIGDPKRQVFVNTFNLFAQDAWQITKKLSLNFGVRYDYLGPMHNDRKDLSVFVPDKGGLLFQGTGISSLYPQDWNNFAPRLGFAYRVKENSDLVVRGSFGVFYDTPNLNPFLDNRPPNGAPNGVEGNPAGSTPVSTIEADNYTIPTNGSYIFPGTGPTCPTGTGCGSTIYNIFSVSQNFRTAYFYNYNLNIEKGLGRSAVFQIGYVGSEGRKLLTISDINQPAPADDPEGLTKQQRRPYYSQFPNFGIINEINSTGNSNYNSLQATLKVREWHRVTSQFAYTWAHSLDLMTAYRGAMPQDNFSPKADYGNSDFDGRHAFTAVVTYDLPTPSKGPKLLLGGWQLSGLAAFRTGQPFNITTSNDNTGTDEGNQRPDLIGDPYAGVSHSFNSAGVTWLNPSAFAQPVAGTFGNLSRNKFYGPGYGAVDLAVFKNTKITERIGTQLRVEMFNLFNHKNFAPPSGTFGSGSFLTTADTIGDYNGAPGIGPGEPFNVQLALKLIF
jgi:hypothetical protein